MKAFVVLLLISPILGYDFSQRKRYDGFSVLEVTPHTHAQNEHLLQLAQEGSTLDFWLEPTSAVTPVHIMVSAGERALLEAQLTAAGLGVAVHVQDVQTDLDAETSRLQGKQSRAYDYNDYNPFEDIESEINLLAADCPSGFSCDVISIGKSVEGRDLWVLKMTTGGSGGRALWVDSTIHSREWLATATVMNVLNKLVRESDDPEAAAILARYDDIYFLPVVNPDGYVYTWTNDRLWRKSRNQNPGSSCIGTDLNRNFAFNWNTGGSSSDPCSTTFHGQGAASEPEVQAVQNYVTAENKDFEVFLTFHTYGQYWLVPYGDCTGPDNEEQTLAVADRTARAIESVYNTRWLDGNSCAVLYATSGSTADWAQGAAGVPYSYTPELRGNSFTPPASFIPPSVAEIWAGLVEMFSAIDDQ
jgi:carboxypeptidase A2